MAYTPLPEERLQPEKNKHKITSPEESWLHSTTIEELESIYMVRFKARQHF